MNLKLLLILILSSLAAILVAQNVATVEIGLLFWSASMSSASLIFFTLMIGFLFGWSICHYILYRKSRDQYVYL